MMKWNRPFFLLCVLLGILLTELQAQDRKHISVEEYISLYKEIAIREMEAHGIPASITLAQGIHESGSGNSRLAVDANNHFGIKCANWGGKTYYKWDDEAQESCFRVYDSPEQSYLDHSKILTTRKRYAFLFEYDKTDYKKWAKGLRKAGYATDPRYPTKLITTIERYELAKYDLQMSSIVISDDQTPYKPVFTDPDDVYVTPSELDRKLRSKPRSFMFLYYKKGLYQQNGITYAVAQRGETALEVAARFDIPYKKFLTFNDLVDGDELIDYQYCYIQPKKRKYSGEKDFHRVTDDVTLYEISQFYGIQLEVLYERNLLEPGQEPRNGELILFNKQVSFPPKIRLSSARDELPMVDIDDTPLPPPVPEFPNDNQAKPVPVPELKINEPTYPDGYYENNINTAENKDDRNIKIPDTPKDPDWLVEIDQDSSDLYRDSLPSWEPPKAEKDNPVPPRPQPVINNEEVLEDNPFSGGPPPAPGNKSYIQYKVQAKETLYSIGKKFGISWERIKAINQLENNTIQENQILKIPKSK